MSESKWKVIGASGFVGSSIVARLNTEGISVDPIEAPRLATRALDVDSIIDEADQLEGIIDSLAEAFACAQVVVNAAGLAAPNMQDLPPLVGANALLPAVIAIAAQRTGGHPAKRTFQALRIEVNAELSGWADALPAAVGRLRTGGRIAVLSYHSLEDRITKRVLSAGATSTAPPDLPVELPEHAPYLRLLTRGAEAPSQSEQLDNPRSASARLRAAERVRDTKGTAR